MSDFDELYQEILLDHYRHPHGAARLDQVSDSELHENPLCGDRIKLETLFGEDGRIGSLRFEASGCAISVASASVMSLLLEGRSAGEARELAERFITMLRGEDASGAGEPPEEFAVFSGVARFPARVKCASLAWHAFLDGLDRHPRG